MAMLTRPTDIKIFGSAALAAELTDFGGSTPSTDINTILNSVAAERGWGTVGANGFPPMEWFNALGYALSYYSAYIMQSGIPAWTSLQNYYVNSYAVGSDGKLYRSKTGINGTPNVGNNPVGDTTNWESTLDMAGLIHSSTAKTTPVDADEFGIWDSVSGLLKKITTANLTAFLSTLFAKQSQLVGFKNYIINGNFDVWQYGTSQTESGYGSDDRWNNSHVGSTKTHSRVACTDTERALFNASYFSRTVVSSVAGASNYVNIDQAIEDVTKLAGKTVTISFWAKADSNKNISVDVYQVFGTGGTPSSVAAGTGILVPLTTTWQKKTVTWQVPSIAGKTLGTDGAHTSATRLRLFFDAGSTFATISGGLGQQSGTFDIAQVQIEEGSVATPFEQRPYGLELSLCQRYYEVIDAWRQDAFVGGQGDWYSTVQFKQTKRISPSVTLQSVINGYGGTSSIVAIQPSSFQITVSPVSTSDGFFLFGSALVSAEL